MRKKGVALAIGLNRQLAQEGVPKEVLDDYHITVRSITPIRGVWRLDTNRGPMCLKRTSYDGTKVSFIFSAQKHLLENGFTRVSSPITTKDGKMFVEHGGSIYYLMNWLRGREIDFTVGRHVGLAARSLAHLHRAARGFLPEFKGLRDYLGTWPVRWETAIAELSVFKDLTRQKAVNTSFDNRYLATADYYLRQAVKALEILEEARYSRLVEAARQEGQFCHRDYTYHNLILNRHGEIHVLDFDYCAFDNKEGDLARFVRKVMEKNSWSWEKALPIWVQYEDVQPLDINQRKLVLAALTFPQSYWRLVRRYYDEPGSKKEESLLFMLSELEENRVAREDFLERLQWEWLE